MANKNWAEVKNALKSWNFAIVSAIPPAPISNKKAVSLTFLLASELILKNYTVKIAYDKYKMPKSKIKMTKPILIVYKLKNSNSKKYSFEKINETDIKKLSNKYKQESYIFKNQLKLLEGNKTSSIKLNKIVFGKEALKQNQYIKMYGNKKEEYYFSIILIK